jgi:hypothetical protein
MVMFTKIPIRSYLTKDPFRSGIESFSHFRRVAEVPGSGEYRAQCGISPPCRYESRSRDEGEVQWCVTLKAVGTNHAAVAELGNR